MSDSNNTNQINPIKDPLTSNQSNANAPTINVQFNPNLPRYPNFNPNPQMQQQNKFPPNPNMYVVSNPNMMNPNMMRQQPNLPGQLPMNMRPGFPGSGQPPIGFPGSGQPPIGFPGSGQPPTGFPGSGQPPTGFPGNGQPPAGFPNFPGGGQQPGNFVNFPPQQIGMRPPQVQNIDLQNPNNNPTGQNRMAGFDNIAGQNIQGNRNETYEGCQETWGSCYGCCYNYICCCCCDSTYKRVPESGSGVIMRFGRFHKIIGPGLHYLNPEIDTLIAVDKREKVMPLQNQVVVTKDNVTLKVDTVVFYKIVNTYKKVFGTQNLEVSLADLMVTAIRNVFGRLTLQEMLTQRDEIDDDITRNVTGPTANWGVKVIRTLIQDLLLPKDIRQQMSAGAVAKKIAEGNVIRAQGDVQSAKLMREAAEVLATDAAMQIRFIEQLENLTKMGNPKMVFFPSDYSQLGSANEELNQIAKEELKRLL